MNDNNYIELLESIKLRIRNSQHKLAMYVNSELFYTYWNIGHALNKERDRHNWGAKVVGKIAHDLKSSSPKLKGMSKRNLQYMMRFAEEWEIYNTIVEPVAKKIQNADNQQDTIVPPLVAQFQRFEKLIIARVPWSHHRLLLDKLDNQEERSFYCKQIIHNSWSKRILINKLDQDLHKSQGKLNNNFSEVLPDMQATLVKETFKDPYFFDFLQLGNEAIERAIEDKLSAQIGQFLLELGAGFAYLGRQYKLEVGGKEYYPDLLFFHTKLNCYINIELKIDEFKPEYAGKSQFYLTVIDDHLKTEYHNPSIGIILCKDANKILVEYTLKESNQPIGVAQYKLVKDLPENMKTFIPSQKEINDSIREKMNDG